MMGQTMRRVLFSGLATVTVFSISAAAQTPPAATVATVTKSIARAFEKPSPSALSQIENWISEWKQACSKTPADCLQIDGVMKKMCASTKAQTRGPAKAWMQAVVDEQDSAKVWDLIKGCSVKPTGRQVSAALIYYTKYQDANSSAWLSAVRPNPEALNVALPDLTDAIYRIQNKKPINLDALRTLTLTSTDWVSPAQVSALPLGVLESWMDTLGPLSEVLGQSDLFEARASKINLGAISKSSDKIWAAQMIDRLCFVWQMEGKHDRCLKEFAKLRVTPADKQVNEILGSAKAWDLFQKGEQVKSRTELEDLVKRSDGKNFGANFRLMLAELATDQLDAALTKSQNITRSVSSQKDIAPWDRLVSQTVELAVLREKRQFAEAGALASKLTTELQNEVKGVPSIQLWIDLEKVYLASLQGRKDQTNQLNTALQANLKQMPSLSLLGDYSQALANAVNGTSKPTDLDRAKTLMGPTYHYVKWTERAIGEIKDKASKQ